MKKYIILSLIISVFMINNSISQDWKKYNDSTIHYYNKLDFRTALSWAYKYEKSSMKVFKETDTMYIMPWLNLSALYYRLGRVDSAIIWQEKIVKFLPKAYKPNHALYAQSIFDLAIYYAHSGKNRQADSILLSNLEIIRNYYKGDNTDLAVTIDFFAQNFYSRGNYAAAEKYFEEAYEMRKRLLKGDHADLASSINNMAAVYDKLGKYDKCESKFKAALEMNRRLYKEDNKELANSLNNMAYYYRGQGKFDLAEPLYKESLEMRRRLFKGDNQELISALNNMASFNELIGKLKEAEIMFKEALEMSKRLFNGDHPTTSMLLSNIGLFYMNTNNLKEAENYNKEALDMRKRIYRKDAPEIALSMNNLAGLYQLKGELKESEALFKEALEIKRRIFKNDHIDLATNINNLAAVEQDLGELDSAEPLYIEAYEMRRRIYKEDNPELVNSIQNLGSLYERKKDNEKAGRYFTEAVDMHKRLFKHRTGDLANLLVNLANFDVSVNKYADAKPLYEECLDIYYEIISDYFPSLSENEKKQFWKKMSPKFDAFYNYAAIYQKDNPSILCQMYNNRLNTKSMLFNSMNNMKKRIISSGDSILINKYKEWNFQKSRLIKAYKMSEPQLKKSKINIDTLEKNINKLEKEISLKSELFAKNNEKVNISWQSIKNSLKPNEAAVEIIRYNYRDKFRISDTVCYAFLIIDGKTTEHPDLILLEDGRKLEKEYFNEYRNSLQSKTADKISFDRFWSKIYERLKSSKVIYLSADGIYNKLNPSILQMPNGKYLMDYQDILQLNSTKDIISGVNKSKSDLNLNKKALLIGNPDFALSEVKVNEAARRIRGEEFNPAPIVPAEKTRSVNLTKLPGTEKEIRDIEKYLKNNNWEVSAFTDSMAVKSSLINSKSPAIIHIATHGFFLEDVNKGGKELVGIDEKKMTDNPLLKSGLFFSGADNFISSAQESKVEEENGLLTAFEAMNLDLENTDLVVLSACETGLGEIQNGEGVFGLRRAFQQAGAKTILASLWKVNDNATQELMSKFYSYLVTGMAKRDAFNKAQKYVRDKYPEPYYWGSFIMVGE